MHNTPTRIYAPLGVVALTVALVLGLASPASALVLLDREDARLSLRGLAEASYMIESAVDEQGHSSFGPVLDMARLDLRAEREHLGALHFQLEGASDDLQVLDAEVSLHPLAPLYIHLGHFKTPISAEFLVARPHLLLPRRAALSQLITRRLTGVELDLHTELGHHWGLRTQVAVFQPEGVEVDGPTPSSARCASCWRCPMSWSCTWPTGSTWGPSTTRRSSSTCCPTMRSWTWR
jgi:hypothetical protein